MNKRFKKHSGRIFGSRLTATISIMLVLLLFAIMMTLGFFAREISQSAKENITITILLHDDATVKELESLQLLLSKAEWAKEYRYIDKESALKELTEELGENPENLLGYNPLPASFEVAMATEFAQIDKIKIIEKQLNSYRPVQEVDYQEDLIQLVNKNIASIGRLLLGIALILVLISIFLIRNTVRLMIYSKRFLINTMCLVGAKRSFIRRPFVWQNVRCGIISAILAMVIYYFALRGMDTIFPGIQAMVDIRTMVAVFIVLLFTGVLIAIIATVFSVNRFLRMHSDDMYYI